jgi:hypothetical protein
VVASVTHESMRRVSDLVEQRPDEDPYKVIKARLLSALQLTDYQRADKLFELPGLGARKPSELMSQMLEICPRGEEKSHLFACLFLRRLPREIWVLLTKVDYEDPKALDEQADELWALHTHDSVVAAVQEMSVDEPAINALKQQSRDKSGGSDRKKKSWTRKKEKSGGQGPSLTAQLESGLCYAHWVYGESAATCHKPCTWQGNGKAGGKLNAISPGNLLHLRDQLSGRHFLVDTGATYSIFPHRSSAPPSGPALTGPGGRAISTWGEREIPLSFDGQHFTWSFLLAAVQFSILGMDFFSSMGCWWMRASTSSS